MAISDYATLKTAISSYLHRSDLNANIPDFVQMAEWRIARDVRITPLINVSTASLNTSLNSISMPSGFLEMVDVTIQSNNKELFYVPPDHIDRVLGNGPSSGTPWLYTLRGASVIVAPPTSATITLNLSFYKKEDSLNDTSASSWFTTNAPDLLLYASLLEASPYLINDERIPVWSQFYEKAVDRVNQQYGVLDPHQRMMKAGQAPADSRPNNPDSSRFRK